MIETQSTNMALKTEKFLDGKKNCKICQNWSRFCYNQRTEEKEEVTGEKEMKHLKCKM